MVIDYTGKVAVVTGGSGGLGSVVVRKLLESGATVAMLGTKAEKVKAVEEKLSALGKVKGYVFNLEETEKIPELVTQIREDLGEIDTLFQCAALMGVGKILTPENWDRCMAINAKSFYFMMKAVVEQSMQYKNNGTILNISSMAGVRGMCPPMCNPIYSATKGAVVALTKQAAVQWGCYGVRANCIAPGAIALDDTGDVPHKKTELGNYVPLGRDATQSDIANFALYLNSDLNMAQTGTVTIVDGGAHAVGY